MALLNPQSPVITGTTPNYSLVTASDTIKFTGGKMFLIVRNTSGAPNVTTVVVPGSKYGQAVPDVAVSVPATNGERWIGPLANDMKGAQNLITVTNSAPAAGVTCALVVL